MCILLEIIYHYDSGGAGASRAEQPYNNSSWPRAWPLAESLFLSLDFALARRRRRQSILPLSAPEAAERWKAIRLALRCALIEVARERGIKIPRESGSHLLSAVRAARRQQRVCPAFSADRPTD